MISSVIVFFAKQYYGKQLLGIVDGINERLSGKRSELIVALLCLVGALQHFGVLDQTLAKQIEALLLGALPITLAEKVGGVLEQADKIIPQPSKTVGEAINDATKPN